MLAIPVVFNLDTTPIQTITEYLVLRLARYSRVEKIVVCRAHHVRWK